MRLICSVLCERDGKVGPERLLYAMPTDVGSLADVRHVLPGGPPQCDGASPHQPEDTEGLSTARPEKLIAAPWASGLSEEEPWQRAA